MSIRAGAQAEIQLLITEFVGRVDEGRAAENADLFSSDGVLETGGRVIPVGDLRVHFGRRAKGKAPTLHCVSAARVEAVDDDEIRGSAVVTSHRMGLGAEPSHVVLSDWRVTVRRTATGWRFARVAVRMFPGDHAPTGEDPTARGAGRGETASTVSE